MTVKLGWGASDPAGLTMPSGGPYALSYEGDGMDFQGGNIYFGVVGGAYSGPDFEVTHSVFSSYGDAQANVSATVRGTQFLGEGSLSGYISLNAQDYGVHVLSMSDENGVLPDQLYVEVWLEDGAPTVQVWWWSEPEPGLDPEPDPAPVPTSVPFAWGAQADYGSGPQGLPYGAPYLLGAQGALDYCYTYDGLPAPEFGPTIPLNGAVVFVEHYYSPASGEPMGLVTAMYPLEKHTYEGNGTISGLQREGLHTFVFWVGGVRQPVRLVFAMAANPDETGWYSNISWYREYTDTYTEFWTLLRAAEETP